MWTVLPAVSVDASCIKTLIYRMPYYTGSDSPDAEAHEREIDSVCERSSALVRSAAGRLPESEKTINYAARKGGYYSWVDG